MKSTSKIINVLHGLMFGLIVLFVSGQAFAQGGSWETKAPMPTARSSSAVGLVDGILYVAGGYSSWHLWNVEAYDPETDTWTIKNPRPTLQTTSAFGVVNGILYTAGGVNCCVSIAETWGYDPTNDSWTQKASMSAPRQNPAADVVNDIVYVAGGLIGSTPLATLEAYDPTTNNWTTKTPMPTARQAPAVGVVDGILYFVGGSDANGVVATLEAYDPVNDIWTTMTPMPTARRNPVSGVVNGKLYVVGGLGANGVLTTVEAYDPTTDSWTTMTPMPTARADSVSAVINDQLYVVGGSNFIGSYFSTVEVFTPPISITVPFEQFTITKAKIEFNNKFFINDSFKVEGEFTLSTSSNGIDPLNEDIEVTVGTSTLTIPAGSFTEEGSGRFGFEGTINDAFVEMVIKQITVDIFKLRVKAEGVDLTNTSNPVDIGVTIGDDTGTANIRLKGKLKSEDDD